MITSAIDGLLKHGTLFHPKIVYLEVSTACNRSCSYCPVSQFPAKQKFIAEDVFGSFLYSIQELCFSGQVCFHTYNEPLLHPGLEALVRRTKDARPQVKIVLYTNGDLLSIDRANKLIIAGVDLFNVTCHEPYRPGWLELFNAVQETFPKHVRRNVITSWHNRGGILTSLPGPNVFAGVTRCRYPEGVNIKINGDVILCCNDFHGKYVFGSIIKETLRNIYFGRHFSQIRKELRHGEFVFLICKECVKAL